MDEAEQITGEKVRVPIALKWLETLLITAFFLAFSVWHRPDDPFYLTGNFPWPVLGPLLVGLRYGFFMALISALIIIAALGFHLRFEITSSKNWKRATSTVAPVWKSSLATTICSRCPMTDWNNNWPAVPVA